MVLINHFFDIAIMYLKSGLQLDKRWFSVSIFSTLHA